MTNDNDIMKPLETLRKEIDSIDDEIHSLLMRRAGIASDVSKVKKNLSDSKLFIRPAREAQILRNLTDKNDGNFPNSLIVRIWREIISATLALESDFAISVFVPNDTKLGLAYELLARKYFGMDTPLKVVGTESGVLRSVRDGKSTVGVLPVPHDDSFNNNDSPWWTILASGGDDRPMIIARLPWCNNPRDAIEGLEALSVACVKPESTGDDITYVALRFIKPISREKIGKVMQDSGLSMRGAMIANTRDKNSDTHWQLFEIDGFVSEKDSRLESLNKMMGDTLDFLRVLGSYARPMRT
tara:strand:+ start:5 stop:901 length:897 start_codon:yes stop_codon:yes gene_type:complete